jgi:IclR family acetate operon transcriptional repressor
MSANVSDEAVTRSSGGVQSLDRAFAILEAMADAGGVIGLSQLAEKVDLPLATIHRLVRTLVNLGYVRQEDSRQYSLGAQLMRLSDTAAKRVRVWTRPAMSAAVAQLGESVNLAVLDADEIVYVAHVQPSTNFMRMFTEVGFRTLPHATAVGKAILADVPEEDVVAMLGRTGMQRHTDRTIATPEDFLTELAEVRRLGYAVDDGEQEIGVRCIGVAVPGTPQPMALSMSGPSARVNDELVERAHRVLLEAAAEIRAVLSRPGPSA